MNPEPDDIDDALDAWMAQWHLSPEDLEPQDPTDCSTCGTEFSLMLLGDLGDLRWFRCRACGSEQCERLPNYDTNTDKEK